MLFFFFFLPLHFLYHIYPSFSFCVHNCSASFWTSLRWFVHVHSISQTYFYFLGIWLHFIRPTISRIFRAIAGWRFLVLQYRFQPFPLYIHIYMMWLFVPWYLLPIIRKKEAILLCFCCFFLKKDLITNVTIKVILYIYIYIIIFSYQHM